MFKDILKTVGIGGVKSKPYTPPVRFYRDAAAHGSHGKIVVNSKQHDLLDREVSFVFEGMTNPPKMSPQVLQYVWEQALEQGYVPQHLVRYHHVMVVNHD